MSQGLCDTLVFVRNNNCIAFVHFFYYKIVIVSQRLAASASISSLDVLLSIFLLSKIKYVHVQLYFYIMYYVRLVQCDYQKTTIPFNFLTYIF